MKKLLFAVGALVALGGLVVKTLSDAGQFKHLEPHFAGQCTPVSGMPGAEDITFHPTQGFAYVSSDDRRATQAGKPVPGGIYRYDPNSDAPPVLLTQGFSQDFHPHGISLYVDPSGAQTIYAVSHPSTVGGQIERFDVGPDGMLIHRATIKDPAIISPNDVVAVDADRFYVTNDHHYASGLARTAEDYLQLSRGNVLFYDGKGFQEVIKGTTYANGINRSADGKTIYVAESVGRLLGVYDRDLATGALKHRLSVPLGTGPDNVEPDAEGNLWIGAHPKLLDFTAHAGDVTGAKRSPSQALKLKPSGDSFQVEEVYLNDGGPLSGSATAAASGKRMLIGPVFAPVLLNCELP
ncbi:SMP-30/gluconolactonase/LRE family protein [Myxococcaceae bacterium GXIMD 01537]